MNLNARNSCLKIQFNDLGMTPAKREFNYPKVLAATSPHDRIIRRFWSNHNESDLDVSMSISEVQFRGLNERKFEKKTRKFLLLYREMKPHL